MTTRLRSPGIQSAHCSKRTNPWMHGFACALIVLTIGLMPRVAMAQAAPPAPYVQQVLARADQAMAALEEKPFVETFTERAVPEWTLVVFSTLTKLVDTHVNVSGRSRDLLSNTSCLHSDLALIEEKMVEVRTKLLEARDRHDVLRILKLQQLLGFLNDRIALILRGALDPSLRDTSWGERYLFDPLPATGWCCGGNKTCGEATPQECDEQGGAFSTNVNTCPLHGCAIPETAPQACPFDSDYLAPSVSGFGCDVEAMTDRMTAGLEGTLYEVMEEERRSLMVVQATAGQYALQAQALQNIQVGIQAAIAGKPIPPQVIAPPKPRTHQRFLGCELPACLNGDTTQCRTMTGAIFTPLRGSFSLDRDNVRLLGSFANLRRNQAATRPASGEFGKPDQTLLSLSFGAYGRSVFKDFSVQLSDPESLIFAVGADPHLSIGDALKPLRESIQRLARLIEPGAPDPAFVGPPEPGESVGKLRGFVRDFATFLRRSCMERPCNERLERVLAIVFQNDCFPYTSGRYLTIDEEAACKKAAELEEIVP